MNYYVDTFIYMTVVGITIIIRITDSYPPLSASHSVSVYYLESCLLGFYCDLCHSRVCSCMFCSVAFCYFCVYTYDSKSIAEAPSWPPARHLRATPLLHTIRM